MIQAQSQKAIVVREDQPNLVTSTGRKLPVKGAWHLELSETKHVFLERLDDTLRLSMKDFVLDGSKGLLASKFSIRIDAQQMANFIFALPDLIKTTRRTEIRKVSALFLYRFICWIDIATM